MPWGSGYLPASGWRVYLAIAFFFARLVVFSRLVVAILRRPKWPVRRSDGVEPRRRRSLRDNSCSLSKFQTHTHARAKTSVNSSWTNVVNFSARSGRLFYLWSLSILLHNLCSGPAPMVRTCGVTATSDIVTFQISLTACDTVIG